MEASEVFLVYLFPTRRRKAICKGDLIFLWDMLI